MIHGYIYLIQNQINGKTYIGQTTQKDPLIRWKQHIDFPNNFPIGKAILKYGSHNFMFRIIDSAQNQKILDELEESYMCLFHSKVSIYGYNIRNGGGNGKFDKKVCQKMGDSRRGEKNPMWGKKHTKETLQKMKKSKSNCSKQNHPRYLDLNDEYIIKLYLEEKLSTREIAKKINCSQKAVLCHLEANNITIRTNSGSQQNKSLFGFSGCSYNARSQNPWTRTWKVRIGYNGKRKFLGSFEDPFTAELVYQLVREEIGA